MAVFGAFKDGWTALLNNPSLLVAAAILTVVGQLRTIGEATGVSGAAEFGQIGFLLAFPFVAGGFVGMALAAVRDAETSLGQFVRAGRAYYLRILGATILLVVAVIGIFVVSMPLSFVPVALVVLGGLGEIAWFAALFVAIGLSLLTIPLVLLAVFFSQFYPAAIVAENAGVRAAFSRSVRLVGRNFPSVVGFTLVWGILSSAILAPEEVTEAVLEGSVGVGLPGIQSGALSVVAASLLVLLSVAASAYFYTVYAAYYVRLLEASTDDVEGGSIR